jgi:hypothetical protein
MTAARRRIKKERQEIGAAVLQTYQDIAMKKKAAGKRIRWVYWVDDDVAARVFRLMGWVPSRSAAKNEKLMRRISGSVSGFIRRGVFKVMADSPHGNRPIRVN